eukprot:3737999-Amphidinium_carterae.1
MTPDRTVGIVPDQGAMSKSTKQAANMKSTNRATLVMVGPTGQGKSTLGNMLAGGGAAYAPFTTSDDFDSETLESAHADFAFDQQELRVIDTIGFLDTRMDANQNMDKFAGLESSSPPPCATPHCTLNCCRQVSARELQQQDKAWTTRIRKALPPIGFLGALPLSVVPQALRIVRQE